MSETTTSPADSLTADDVEFLRRPLLGAFTTAAGPVPPQPRPVWFEAAEDGTVQLFTAPDSLKIRRLHRDPRASMLIAAPSGEPERWLSVAGRVTIESEGAHDLAARLAERYWDLSDPTRADDLAGILEDKQVRVIIHPELVRRFSF